LESETKRASTPIGVLAFATALCTSTALMAAATGPVEEIAPEFELEIEQPYTVVKPVTRDNCDVWIEMELSASAEPKPANILLLDQKGSEATGQVAKESFAKAVAEDNFAHPNLIVNIRFQNNEIDQYAATYFDECRKTGAAY